MMSETAEVKMLHEIAVIRRFVEPWAGTQRIVCTDSYFASVEDADEMRKIGLRFIGVVKTACTKFQMKYMSGMEVGGRGNGIIWFGTTMAAMTI